MKRVLLGIVFVVAVVVAAFAVFFPTEDLVHRALDGIGGSVRVTFGGAHLRPWGLVVENVSAQLPDGRPVLSVESVRVRPSLRGIFALTGRPWIVNAKLCNGDLSFDIDAGTTGGTVKSAWSALQLDRCGFPAPFDTFKGSLTGDFDLTATGGSSPPKGAGHLQMDGIQTPLPEGGSLGLDQLQLEQFVTEWTFDGDAIKLSGLSLKTPEVVARGDGSIFPRGQIGDSRLQLRLTAKPQPYAPPKIRKVFEGLPAVPGEPDARLVIVEGTIGNPRVVQHE